MFRYTEYVYIESLTCKECDPPVGTMRHATVRSPRRYASVCAAVVARARVCVGCRVVLCVHVSVREAVQETGGEAKKALLQLLNGTPPFETKRTKHTHPPPQRRGTRCIHGTFIVHAVRTLRTVRTHYCTYYTHCAHRAHCNYTHVGAKPLQCRNVCERTPPSHTVAFWPRSGTLKPPSWFVPPLSARNKKT